MFAGSLPTTPDAMQRHMELRVGMESNPRIFNRTQPWKIHPTAAGQGLRQLMSEDRSHAMYELECSVQQKRLAAESSGHQRKQPRQLTPDQFISQLGVTMPEIMKDVRIDYIPMVKICNALLAAVRSRLQQELGVFTPPVREAGDSNDHGVVYMVLGVFMDNNKAAAAHERMNKKSRGTFEGGPEMKVAARSMDEFMKAKHLRLLKTAG